MRSPVDIHLAVVQPVVPFAQRGRRQMQRGGVLPHAHPAPVHHLDVHRPERLEGATAHVRAHAKTKAGALLPALFLSLVAPLTTQFRLIFRMPASRFLAGQVVQPATERCRRQTMLTAILRPAKPAPTPGFNVNQPPGLPRLVLETSQSHRSSSTLPRSLKCRAIALLNLCAETGRLRADHGRQDKSAAFRRPHVVGWIEDFRHPAYWTCWRFRQKRERFQCSERHHSNRRKRCRP
jgi:hypothetical protein